jgi:hypothetical protein
MPLSTLGLVDFFGGVRFDGQRIRFGAVETNREPKNHESGKGQAEYFDFHSARGNVLVGEPVPDHASESARSKFPPRINSMLREEYFRRTKPSARS